MSTLMAVTSFGYATGDADAPEIDVIVNSDNNTGSKTVTIADAFDLTLDPPKQNEKNSVHTWEAGYVNFDGEVDTITVDYTTGGKQEPSLDGLNQGDITVVMTRQLDGGKDTSEIDVNDDSYSGAVDTFDLSGFYNTDIAGSLTVTIGDSSAGTGVENPKGGNYEATIILEGPNDRLEKQVSYEVG